MIKIVNAATANLPRIATDVLCGQTTVLKDAVPSEIILRARMALHEWAQSTVESKGHPKESGGASHIRNYLPPRSQSRYICHDFNILADSDLPVVAQVMPVFEFLRRVYVGLFGFEFEFGVTYDGFSFLPQVIQYPRGGGFFQEHFHDIEPQRIGLVLSGSTYGTDLNVGGGRFRATNGSWDSTESIHNVGDVSLFRYDIGHDITPVDPDVPLDWSRSDGRWSFVLPLKPVS